MTDRAQAPLPNINVEDDESDDDYDVTCDVDVDLQFTPRVDKTFPYLDEIFEEMENDQKTSEDICN